MNKICLITGATGGIGLATAKALGKADYFVIINGIDEVQAKEAKAELESLNIKYDYYHFDVTNEEEVKENMAKIGQKYGHLDVLVNNAGGLGGRSSFEGMPTDFYRRVLALNLDSVFFVTREAIPLLKEGKDASIINFSSNAGWNAGGPGAGVYATAKGAVITLTRALAKELVKYNIRVNGVAPGTIDTPFHQQTKINNPALFESFKNNIPMKRLGQASEVASVIEFLVSDKASFLTGEIIQVNGGQDFL